MAQSFLIFFITIHSLLILTKASETVHTLHAPTSTNAEAPMSRRLGKHRHKHSTVKISAEAPYISPAGFPQTKHLTKPNAAPTSSNAEAPVTTRLANHGHMSPAGLPQTKDEHKHSNEENNIDGHHDSEIAPTEQNHHHHISKLEESVAGGGVIVGGLATTFLVAIFCYIRATRRKSLNPSTSSP